MSDAVLIALIAVAGSIVTSLIGAFVAWKVSQLGKSVNGVLHEFTAAKVGEGFAKGVHQGEQDQRDRQNTEAQP